MADFSSITAESLVETCRENTAAIAESLNQCFNTEHILSIGEAAAWSEESVPAPLDGPGMLVTCRVGEQSLLCAIAESLPIPNWYTDPGDSEFARMETLAMEWSMNLLPTDLECEEFFSSSHENLSAAIKKAEPAEGAQLLPIVVDEEEPRLWVIWPLSKMVEFEDEEEQPAEPEAAEVEPQVAPPPVFARPTGPDPLARVRNLEVTVIVKLAERRVEINELLKLSPGTIVTFEQPCENLLELMINNQTYALGEAVKIGENFGIKISEVGYRPHREPRVIG